LRDLLGEDASGLSASSIQRLTEQWQAEHAAFRARELRFHRYAYLFVDGVNVKVRLGEDPKLCLLVVIGVREDGEKELLAVEDGYRESEDSWSAVFRDLRDRGMNEPKLVTGDGALGAWAALRSVFPGTREQRCWVHYADPPVMPTRDLNWFGGGRIRGVWVGIIRALRGTRGARRGVGSGLAWRPGAWSGTALAL
jgi:transposase-like protein